MSSDPQRVQAVFNDAVQKSDSERGDFLDVECAGDNELRRRVEALIGAHEQSGSFLDSPPKDLAGTSPTIVQPLAEQVGSLIGPFKLLQQIGEGGMGAVFMAEQIEPVERRVAVKIIKPGMDTKAVIARFEAERQALAMMDHPNIAKVLDVGTTNSGRPYFVMELVRGIPITQYCDEHRLTPRERLELFLPVCQAVQHAHQKGIIHRDIKPTNVLVAEYDDRAVPKIIDFGLAKAVEKRLTAKTLFTEFGQILGTIDYMSPEQAKLNQLDIDTRSDIYSLGVLLYELLPGNTPFDRERLRSAAFDELLRIIREEEPPKPSLRSSTVDTLPSVAASRRIDPSELTRQLRGELDWIVMKTLEKDRSRRYETANGLANDLRRYLNDEPVDACPPSTAYRFRKFARRNKGPIAVATAVTAALVVLAVGSLITAGQFRSLARRNAELAVAARNSEATAKTSQQEAEAARDKEQNLRVEAERQTKIATDALADAQDQRERAEANFVLARSAVDEFLNHVTENELLTVPGMQPLRQELLSSAMEFYDDFTQDEKNSGELLVELASAHHRIAVIRGELGQTEASSTSNAKSIELFEQLRDSGSVSLEVRLGLAKSFFHAKRYDDSESLCREILETNAGHAATRSLLASSYNSLAVGGSEQVGIATALMYHQQSLALREGLASEFPNNPDYLAQLGSTLNNLGVLLGRQNRNREALAMYQRGVSYSSEAYELAPETITWGRWLSIGLRNVAMKQASFGEQDEALQSYQRYVDVRRKLAFENPAVSSLKGALHKAWIDLANYQRELQLTVEANRSMKAAQELLENIPRNTPAEMFDLAIVYGALSLPTENSVESTGEDETERQRFADLAMETIAQAVRNGYRDVNTLKSHKYLDALRERDDFETLIKEIQAINLVANEADTDELKLANRRESIGLLRELVGNDSAGRRHRKTLAATLHSIGEIQIGLGQHDKAEKSLQEALKTREAILDEQPDDPQSQLDVLAVEHSRVRLYMAQERHVEAHRFAQRCLDRLLQVARNNRENQDLQKEVSIQERRIYQIYGRCGLFPLVRDYATRSVKFHRVWSTADVRELASEGEFSAIVLLDTDKELARDYLKQLAESVQNTEYQWTFDVIHLVRVLAAAGETDLLSDELLARYQTVFEEKPNQEWIAVGMAMVHYRHDRYADAQMVLETFRSSNTPQLAFLDAAIASKLGDKERAQQRWTEGETRYRQNSRAALNRGVADNNKGVFNQYWWQFAYDQAMRRVALAAMPQGPVPDDPWQHLIQARGYGVIGESERADVDLAAALAASANNGDALIARMGLFEQLNDDQYSTEAEWQTIVDLAANDPLVWIHRGRRYMQRGEKQKAEADFSKAASLTPNELNKFLEAGWWLAGPYPPELSDSYRPEIDADPSKPAALIDVKSGPANTPPPWLDLQHENDGFIHPKHHFGGEEGGSVYAMTHVYSPDERTELIRVDRANGARVWWNGRLVFRYDGVLGGDALALRIPVTIRAGLNELLLQTRADRRFKVYLGDAPSARVYKLAEQELWQRALEAVVENRSFSNDEIIGPFRHLLNVCSLVGDQQLLHRVRDKLLVNATASSSVTDQSIAAQILVLSNESYVRPHAEEILASLKRTLPKARKSGVLKNYRLRAMTLYAALLGNKDEAQQYLRELTYDWNRTMVAPLRAIVLHGDQQHEQAVAELEMGLEHWRNREWLWYQKIWYLAVLREAERQVTGVTTRTDEIVNNIEQQALVNLQNRDPKTAAFDHLVETYGRISSERDHEYPYLMRGRRLAELGRDADAAADFNKVVALRSQDGKITAELQRQLGNQLGSDKEWAAAASIFHRIHQDSPDDADRWTGYATALARSGQLARYREFCRSLFEKHGQTDSIDVARALTYCCLQGPDAVDDWSVPIKVSQLLLTGPGSKAEQTLLVSAVLCRAGQYERSLQLTTEAIELDKREPHGWDCFLRAMAYAGLGDLDQATSLSKQARELADSGKLGDSDNEFFEHVHRELTDKIADLIAAQTQGPEEAKELLEPNE